MLHMGSPTQPQHQKVLALQHRADSLRQKLLQLPMHPHLSSTHMWIGLLAGTSKPFACPSAQCAQQPSSQILSGGQERGHLHTGAFAPKGPHLPEAFT